MPKYDNAFKVLHADGSQQDGLVFHGQKGAPTIENVRIAAMRVLGTEELSSIEFTHNKAMMYTDANAAEKGEKLNVEVDRLVRKYIPKAPKILGTVVMFRVDWEGK